MCSFPLKRALFLAAALVVGAAVLTPGASRADGPDAKQAAQAEKLYRAMEKKILAAKSLQVDFAMSLTEFGPQGPSEKFAIQGTLVLAPGNKYRVTMEVITGAKAESLTFVSDGKTHKQKAGNQVHLIENLPAPQQAELMRILFTRAGTLGASSGNPGYFTLAKNVDLEKQFTVKDFALGKSQKIGGRDVQAIEYQVDNNEGRELYKVVMYIDVKTHLPVQLELFDLQQSRDIPVLWEGYSSIILDGPVDEKLFQLP